jgi:hypothetical protein
MYCEFVKGHKQWIIVRVQWILDIACETHCLKSFTRQATWQRETTWLQASLKVYVTAVTIRPSTVDHLMYQPDKISWYPPATDESLPARARSDATCEQFSRCLGHAPFSLKTSYASFIFKHVASAFALKVSLRSQLSADCPCHNCITVRMCKGDGSDDI